jgi:FkbM family methyltransferase
MYLDILKSRAYRAIASRRQSRTLAWFDRAAKAYIRAYDNLNYDMHSNGEEEILRRVARIMPEWPCLFDVGANIGEWARTALAHIPRAHIDCFEIVPETFRSLEVAMRGIKEVAIHDVGLGAFDGDMLVEIHPGDDSRASTILLTDDSIARPQVLCQVMRGDEYCRISGVNQIHFLKIDTEGADFDVMQGFSGMLTRQAVDMIQFEYGLWSIWTKSLLRDHYEFLTSHGYRVGKIYPGGVDFRDYDAQHDETFRGPNYLAVRQDRADLIRAVVA